MKTRSLVITFLSLIGTACGKFESLDSPELFSQSSSANFRTQNVNTPAGKVWVYQSDKSLSQFHDGGGATSPKAVSQPLSVPLAVHEKALMNAGVSMIEKSLKQMPIQLPFSLPISTDAAFRGGDGSYIAGARPGVDNINPAPLSSGIINSFLIDETSISKAEAAGFRRLNTSLYTPEQPCGPSEAIVAFGQSNSANSAGTGMQTNTRPINNNILMFFNGHCYPARDPLLGASIWAGGASVWLELGREYVNKKPGQKIVIVAFGVGSSGSFDWAAGGILHQRLKSALKQVTDARLNVKYVFWHQGETDAINSYSYAEGIVSGFYLQRFDSIKNTVHSALPNTPILLASGTYFQASPMLISRDMQNAFFEIAKRRDPLLRMGLMSDWYTISFRRNMFHHTLAHNNPDDVHFNDQSLPEIGRDWYRLSFGQPDPTDVFMESLIRVYLSRSPQAGEISQLKVLGSFAKAQAFVLGSDEYYIRELYRRHAKRYPETEGYHFWLQRLQSSNGDRSTLENDFMLANQYVNQRPDTRFFEPRSFGMGWWGSGFNFLHPIHEPGPFTLNADAGFWHKIGSPLAFPGQIKRSVPTATPNPNPTTQNPSNLTLQPTSLTARKGILALYITLFNRAPEPAGVQYWLTRLPGSPTPDSMVSVDQLKAVAAEMINSQSLYLGSQGMGATSGFVKGLYVNTSNQTLYNSSNPEFWINRTRTVGKPLATAEFIESLTSYNKTLSQSGLSTSGYALMLSHQNHLVNRIAAAQEFASCSTGAFVFPAGLTMDQIYAHPLFTGSIRTNESVGDDRASLAAARERIKVACFSNKLAHLVSHE